MAFSGKADQVN